MIPNRITITLFDLAVISVFPLSFGSTQLKIIQTLVDMFMGRRFIKKAILGKNP
jgi:hypothetical protein